MDLLNAKLAQVQAFAPATSANLGVGFDILGLALSTVGDKVTLTQRQDGKIVIERIINNRAPTPATTATIPLTAQHNTASYAISQMCHELGIDCGFSLVIEKGIALGSGMGGSAASAVAAVVALNHFLTKPLSKIELVKFALAGEELASGSRHADNVAPCLFGGITLIQSLEPLEIISLPYPQLYCVVIHPHLQVETKTARKILSPNVTLERYIAQSAHLAATISALYQGDYQLLQRSLQDLIIEPQRAQLVTGFSRVKQAALASGALSVTLSGSGPSLLAWCQTLDAAAQVSQAMLKAFGHEQIAAESWISPINPEGAHVIKSTLINS